MGSLFAGIGGIDLAFEQAGFTIAWQVEIDPVAQSVLARHWPDVPRYGDITTVDPTDLEPVDVITFGSPCFPAGTLVLTERGYRPIETIRVGDRVLTHRNRWQPVVATGQRVSDTVVLKGQGHFGIESTKDHPFWSADIKRQYPTYSTGKRGTIRTLTAPEWRPAAEMPGHLWATPTQVEALPIPPIERLTDKYGDSPVFTPDFWWMVGRWLGDGWVRVGQRPGRPSGETWGTIFIGDAYTQREVLRERLNRVIKGWKEIEERTIVKFKLERKALANWLETHFGAGAKEKRLPGWAFGMAKEDRQALLEGYLSSDGYHRKPNEWRVNTVSKQLALGMRLLGETLGYVTSLWFTPVATTKVIEGRVVNQSSYYSLAFRQGDRENGLRNETHHWYSVKQVQSGKVSVKVFNLEVAEDNTYVVENIVVHNCQDLSIAGKRAGLSGERSNLFYEAIRLITALRPAFAVWENVPGAFSSNAGRDFAAVLAAFRDSGVRECAWRVLDAQYFGVPQRRRRVFLVADYRGDRATQILFEPQSLSGDSAPRSNAGRVIASLLASGAGTSRPAGLASEPDFLIVAEDSASADAVAEESPQVFGVGGASSVTHAIRSQASRADKPSSSTYIVSTDALDCRNLALSAECSAPLQAKPNGGWSLNFVNPIMVSVAEKANTVTTDAQCDREGEEAHLIVIQDARDLTTKQQNGVGISVTDIMYTLDATSQHAIAHTLRAEGADASEDGTGRETPLIPVYSMSDQSTYSMACSLNQRGEGRLRTVHGALMSSHSGKQIDGIIQNMQVRRLMPVETERLQGLPDDWTRWGADGTEIADTPRYRMIGNSVAVPVLRWIAQRMMGTLRSSDPPEEGGI